MEHAIADLFQSGRDETHTHGATGTAAINSEPIGRLSSLIIKGKSVVYVVDDHSDVRRAIHFSLSAVGIVGWSFANAHDFLEQLDTLVPAPVLLDLRMPGIDGLEALAILRSRDIHWPVIMMSAHGEIPLAVRAIQLGAVDFLEKPFCFKDLEEGLGRAYENLEQTIKANLTRRQAQELLATLTPREKQVLNLLVSGLSNKVVASQLGISDRTVEIHRFNLMAKLGLKSLAQAVSLLVEANGSLDWSEPSKGTAVTK